MQISAVLVQVKILRLPDGKILKSQVDPKIPKCWENSRESGDTARDGLRCSSGCVLQWRHGRYDVTWYDVTPPVMHRAATRDDVVFTLATLRMYSVVNCVVLKTIQHVYKWNNVIGSYIFFLAAILWWINTIIYSVIRMQQKRSVHKWWRHHYEYCHSCREFREFGALSFCRGCLFWLTVYKTRDGQFLLYYISNELKMAYKLHAML